MQGTKGIWEYDRKAVFLEDRMPAGEHKWEPFEKYRPEFEHPIWQKNGQEAQKTGHGGGDYFVIREFVESIKNKTQPAIDVYDCATWSAIVELSQTSVARGSMPIDFPDFTRGKWKKRKPVFGLQDDFSY